MRGFALLQEPRIPGENALIRTPNYHKTRIRSVAILLSDLTAHCLICSI